MAKEQTEASPLATQFDDAHRVIKKGDIVGLRRMLEQELSPNLLNRFSWTLLMLSAVEGNSRIGELLITNGADLDKRNDFGETALSLAAHKGHLRFVQLLLFAGASTDCQPHGHTLDEWVTISSGLSREKIDSVLGLIRLTRLN
jgi:ankyrin repeat protein